MYDIPLFLYIKSKISSDLKYMHILDTMGNISVHLILQKDSLVYSWFN